MDPGGNEWPLMSWGHPDIFRVVSARRKSDSYCMIKKSFYPCFNILDRRSHHSSSSHGKLLRAKIVKIVEGCATLPWKPDIPATNSTTLPIDSETEPDSDQRYRKYSRD